MNTLHEAAKFMRDIEPDSWTIPAAVFNGPVTQKILLTAYNISIGDVFLSYADLGNFPEYLEVDLTPQNWNHVWFLAAKHLDDLLMIADSGGSVYVDGRGRIIISGYNLLVASVDVVKREIFVEWDDTVLYRLPLTEENLMEVGKLNVLGRPNVQRPGIHLDSVKFLDDLILFSNFNGRDVVQVADSIDVEKSVRLFVENCFDMFGFSVEKVTAALMVNI